MKSSSIVSHPNKSPSEWQKAMILVPLLLLGIGTQAALAEGPDFFPLQIGNRWTYVDSNVTPPDTFTVSITDTVLLDGRTYYSFRGIGHLFYDFAFAQESLYRKDSKGDVCVYYPAQQRECPRFRFPIGLWGGWQDTCLVIGLPQVNPETWFSREEDLHYLRSHGALPNYIPIEGREGVNLYLEGFMDFVFVSDIGIVLVTDQRLWGRWPIFLIDAVVAGKRLPQTTLVRSTSWGTIKAETR